MFYCRTLDFCKTVAEKINNKVFESHVTMAERPHIKIFVQATLFTKHN